MRGFDVNVKRPLDSHPFGIVHIDAEVGVFFRGLVLKEAAQRCVSRAREARSLQNHFREIRLVGSEHVPTSERSERVACIRWLGSLRRQDLRHNTFDMNTRRIHKRNSSTCRPTQNHWQLSPTQN